MDNIEKEFLRDLNNARTDYANVIVDLKLDQIRFSLIQGSIDDVIEFPEKIIIVVEGNVVSIQRNLVHDLNRGENKKWTVKMNSGLYFNIILK